MTTPETPEQPENTPTETQDNGQVPPRSSGSSRSGGLLGNKWVLIGGGVAGVVVVVIIIVVVVMGAGGGPSGSTLQLIPEDTFVVGLLDVKAVRENPDDFPGDYDDFIDGLQENILEEFDTEEIDVEQVSNFVFWISELRGGSDSVALLLQGDFFFGDIRDDWDDQDFDEESYKGYEYWDGPEYYALLEDEGAIIGSSSENLIKEIIKIVDQGDGSLADTKKNSRIKLILDKLGSSPAAIASLSGICEDALSGCDGWGAAFTGFNPDRSEVSTDLVVLFSSERRAERAAEDYDDVAEFLERYLGNMSQGMSKNDGVMKAEDVEIDDLSRDGVFVVGSGIIEVEEEE